MHTPFDLANALPVLYSVVYIQTGSLQRCFYKGKERGKEGGEDRNCDILINMEYFAIIKKIQCV